MLETPLRPMSPEAPDLDAPSEETEVDSHTQPHATRAPPLKAPGFTKARYLHYRNALLWLLLIDGVTSLIWMLVLIYAYNL